MYFHKDRKVPIEVVAEGVGRTREVLVLSPESLTVYFLLSVAIAATIHKERLEITFQRRRFAIFYEGVGRGFFISDSVRIHLGNMRVCFENF